MEIDELGMYYIKKQVEDKENILAENCEECGDKFKENDKVYLSNEYSEKHKEYCKDCKRQLEVAHKL